MGAAIGVDTHVDTGWVGDVLCFFEAVMGGRPFSFTNVPQQPILSSSDLATTHNEGFMELIDSEKRDAIKLIEAGNPLLDRFRIDQAKKA